MSALGKWIEFTEIKEKSLGTTNDDLMHGKVVSVGDEVALPIKVGAKVIVSTVKKIQDYIEGETRYFVLDSAIISIIK